MGFALDAPAQNERSQVKPSARLPDGDRVLRLPDVAAMLTLSVKSVRRMIDRGELPATKVGGVLLVRESAVIGLVPKLQTSN